MKPSRSEIMKCYWSDPGWREDHRIACVRARKDPKRKLFIARAKEAYAWFERAVVEDDTAEMAQAGEILIANLNQLIDVCLPKRPL